MFIPTIITDRPPTVGFHNFNLSNSNRTSNRRAGKQIAPRPHTLNTYETMRSVSIIQSSNFQFESQIRTN